MNKQKNNQTSGPRRMGLVMQSLRTGGLEALVVRLAQAYQERGLEPEVVAYEDGELREVLEASRIPVHCFHKPDGYIPSFSKELSVLFAERGYEVVHTHHFGPLIYATPGTCLHRIPLVHTVHSNEHLVGGAAKARAMFLALSRSCGSIVTVNASLATFLQREVGVEKGLLHPIPNGVDSGVFHGGNNKELRRSLGVPDEALLVGTVARSEPEKGHRFLLEALPMVRAGRPLHWLVVGGGSELSGLEARARELGLQDRVHLLGNRRDIPELLSTMDYFVLPSLREGLPLAMLEAMASGLAVIGTEVGGVPRLLNESGAGLCVEPGRPESLATALETLGRYESLRDVMASKGQGWVKLHYGQDRMVESYLEQYQRARATGLVKGAGGAALSLGRTLLQRIGANGSLGMAVG
jgi:glycosyltransferase involved in cell wall biosynthesis